MPGQSKREDKGTKKRCVLIRYIWNISVMNRMTILMKTQTY